MKKFLFSHSLLAKNKAALNRSKLTLASRLLYMSTEVANRAERVKGHLNLLKAIIKLLLDHSKNKKHTIPHLHFPTVQNQKMCE